MIAYMLINEAVRAFTKEDIADELGVSIRDGSVIMHLLRPVPYNLYILSTMTGKNIYKFLFTTLPILVFGSIFIGFPLPASVPHGLFFLCLTLTGILIIFEIIYIFGLFAFWSQKTWYLKWYINTGERFFGGTIVPLWFYPDVLEKITVFLPFRYISFEGINYYVGKASVNEGWYSLAIAFSWVLILFGIGQFLWMRAQKKLTINGG
jgi:ABC-2 type transport system permease protein